MVLGDQESWKIMVNEHFPPESKAEAVALHRSRPGAIIASIADDLSVNEGSLRSWVRLDDQRRGGDPHPGRTMVAG